MSILLPPKTLPLLQEPLWLPAPEYPNLPPGQLHLWRVRMEEPRWRDEDRGPGCPVSRGRTTNLKATLFRQEILGRYTGAGSGLRVAVAHCEHLALIAVSRNVRGLGLDLERVREDIPFEEMAGGFLDARSQWDLRITWSPQEKAWKFFRFWTSSEACAQAHPSPRSTPCCQIRVFSPEADFIAALAVEGGPEAEVVYWDWQCSLSRQIRYCAHTPAR